jgi:bifunctional DNA-binding transcriptional regulator/antitoxin component of YhaV-PrlF toxin-antitoxin module
MPAIQLARIQPGGGPRGRRLNLPKSWTDALGLEPGDTVELAFDDVLLVIPRRSPQSERVRRAMAEAKS